MRKFLLFLIPLQIFAEIEYRFPKPEFTTGYQEPKIINPPVQGIGEIWWTALLIILLILTVLAVYRWRSRKVSIILSLISLVLFGFIRNGCVCSVGSFQNVIAACFDSSFPLTTTVLLFFGLPLIFALFWGRVFCGTACPLGAIQELLHLKSIKVPYFIDRIFRFLPVFMLLVGALVAANQTAFAICEHDPFVGIFRLGGTTPMMLCGLFLLVIGLFVARPYCRYLCPYGVLLGWFSLFSSQKVSITPSDCINCRLCESGCPNGAIIPPIQKITESRKKSINRIKKFLLFTPGLLVISYAVGTLFGPRLAKLDFNVRLLNDIQNGIETDATTAFLGTGEPLQNLVDSVNATQLFMHIGCGIIGVIFCLTVLIELIKLCRINDKKGYTVNMQDCVCCSRCYKYCPVKKETNGGE